MNFQSAASRESLSDFGGGPGASAANAAEALNSRNATPCGSPTQTSHGKRQFLLSSLKKRRSKSHANIAPLPSKLLQQHQRDSCDAKDSKQNFNNNPEQEILAFQRELQNLPDFDLSENAGPQDIAEIMAGKQVANFFSRYFFRIT